MPRAVALVVVLLFALPAVADDPKPFPKPLKDGEKVKADGWFGKRVLPKRDEDDIRIGDWKDGKQTTWTPHTLLNCTVREDRDGYLRVYDGRREGWVSKDDMVPVEDATAYFDMVVKERPNDAHGWWMRGIGWAAKGEHDNAIKDLTEAIRLKPDESACYNARGVSWSNQGEYDKAIAEYDSALKLDPNAVMVVTNRGAALYAKKQYAKARAAHEAALALDPNAVVALCRLAWALACCPEEKHRDGKKAVELGRKLIELDGKWWDSRGTLAAAYAEVGDFEEAVAEQKKAVEMLKAEKNPDTDDLKDAEARLELYRAKKPYRDEAK